MYISNIQDCDRGIIAWLRQKKLERRKKAIVLRLLEIRTSLRHLKPHGFKMRSAIQSELIRIRELNKQLKKVKNEKELQYWHSLFSMCLPTLNALLGTSLVHTKTKKLKKGDKK